MLDGAGLFAGNDCPPDLDLSGVSRQTIRFGETLAFNLFSEGATAVDLDASGNPTGDTIRVLADPDIGTDTPVGVTLSEAGDFSWTPTDDQVGLHTITVIAIDQGVPALADAETFEVRVLGVNESPDIEAIADQQARVGEELVVNVTATDPNDGDSLTFFLDPENTPASATIEQTSNTTATIRWTPEAGDLPGPASFTVLVSDDGSLPLADSESFSVTLTGSNEAPDLAAIADQAAMVGTQMVVNVTATDPDAGDTLTFSLDTDNGATPAGAILQQTSNTTATIRWTPELADVGAPVPFRVLVTDDGSPAEGDSEDFAVTVSPADGMMVLAEEDNFLTTMTESVQLGQSEGTRTLAFDLDAAFDQGDTAPAVEDLFQVFLVDASDPTQTLLDNGEPGTAVFSLAGGQAEYQPGQVRYDGARVEIDVTSLGDLTDATLVFQVLNSDSDEGTRVALGPVSNTIDTEALARPMLAQASNPISPGGELALGTLAPTSQVQVSLQNVRFDPDSGDYTAEVVARNNGPDIGRQLAVVFPGLPSDVTFENASGGDGSGDPYINLTAAIGSGGLAAGASSRPVTIRLANPNGSRFSLTPTVLSGGANTAPTLGEIAPITAVPGDYIAIQLDGQDADGDTLTYSLASPDPLPGGMLMADGRLIFQPAPGQQGSYDFSVSVSDGMETVTRSSSITVETDPITTTRFTGRILDTNEATLVDMPIEIRGADGAVLLSTTTNSDGSFFVESATPIAADTVVIRGDAFTGTETYPFIAEKLPLVLGHEVYDGAKNVIFRPVYLPALDVAGGTTIDPAQNTTVDQEIAPGEMASVFVQAGSLQMDDGAGNMVDFDGTLSITEVPTSLTPAALPVNLVPDTVVTIQPGEMVFTDPAELTLPNRSGYAPGTEMDLWSINPETGDFDLVGRGRVTPDGQSIETISGGINNSSWHMFVPPPPPEPETMTPDEDEKTPPEDCLCPKETAPAKSEVELHSGALQETIDLVTYQSLGEVRGVQLYYDSLNADPRPILHFGYNNIPAADPRLLVAELEFMRGDFMYQVPGFAGGKGLDGGEHFWSLPAEGGEVEAALQADLSALPTGVYNYTLRTGLFLEGADGQLSGSFNGITGDVTISNMVDSPFGAGWSLAGLHTIVEGEDGTVLLMDGGGGRLVFEPDPDNPGEYLQPPADFSTLEKLPDGTFRRTTTDQTVYAFNDRNHLATMTDSNGRVTEWRYDAAGLLTTWIDPTGLQTAFNYTEGRVSSIVDPAGRTTQLRHDAVGDLIEITEPDSSTRTFGYDSNHRLTTEVDQLGFTEEATYNFAGRVVSATLKDGSVRQFMPAQAQVLLPASQTIDPDSPPVAVSPKEAVGMQADENGSVVETNLNRFGQAETSVDSEGALTRFGRDANNLVTITGDGRGNVTSYEYDDNGNVITVRDTIAGSGDALLSNSGTEFWLAFQANDQGGRSTESLFLSSQNQATVVVEALALGFSETVSVTPGEITTVTLPDAIGIRTSDQTGDLGVHVSADTAISVYGLNQVDSSTDGFLGLPVSALGTEYLVMSALNSVIDGTQFAVVATEDDTVVTITPTQATGSRAAGIPYSITLDRGQTYQLQNTSPTGDLTGTVVVSDRPIAVFSGHNCANVPTTSTACDHLVEQLPSTNTWGQAFVTAPLATRQMGDTFRILASTDDTSIFINGELVTTINRGEFHEQLIETASTITTSKPALVAQFSNGTSFDNVTGDPFMALVPPFEQFTNTYTVSTPASGINNNFINVVAPTSAIGAIRLNGELIAEDQFAEIGGTDFSAAQLTVPIGTHTLDSVLNFGVLAYGFDQADSYGYLGGQAFSPAASRSFTYDPVFNQLTSFTDELGRVTLYEVDPANGNRLSTREIIGEVDDPNDLAPDDLVTTFTYTSLGLVDTTTDPLGRVTDFDYDSLGRLTTVTFAAGTADEAMQSFEYDAAGNQNAVIDENGNRTEFAYDSLNRLTQITEPDPDGAGPLTAPVTSFGYDARGDLIATTDARGNVTTNAYDSLSRLATTTDADGQVTTFGYDIAGNLARVTDPLGFTTHNEYDGRNRLIETTDPEGGVTQFAYDTDNNLVGVLDPVGNETRFRYDARDRLVQETDPLGATTSYAYDAADNLIRKTDRNGRVTEFAYDDVDRLTAETWLDDDGVTALNTVTYAYDKASNLLSVVDAFSALAFTYDNRDRVDTVDNSGTPNTPSVVLDYGYDGVGNVTSVTDTIEGAAGATTSYAYDALNRTTSIQQSGSGVADKLVDFVYNELGQFDEIARYSDLGRNNLVAISGYEYDELNRLTDLDHTNAADEVLAFYDFEYDPSSRITKITDIDGATDYAYDDRSQLTGAERDAGDARGDESYAYDENGNRTSSHLHGAGYVTGDGNRLLSDGTYDYEYDAEGNTTRRTEIATGDYRVFEWDHRNRLVRVTDFSSGDIITQEVEFAYDALERRISAGVDSNGAAEGGDKVTFFVYERDNVLLDFVDADGGGSLQTVALSKRYLHGPMTDQVVSQEAEAVEWLLVDQLGTTRDLLGNDGTLLDHYRYDSYGGNVQATTDGATTRYLFTGRELDLSTGLYFFRRRYFDPSIGAFLSEDPLGIHAGDANLLRYVFNHPIGLTDPSGLQAECPPRRPQSTPEGWKPYYGYPEFFHCGFDGIIEERLPRPGSPQNECFYDDLGDLVDESHPYSGCGGTPNYYDSENNWLGHTTIDPGGIVRAGIPAMCESINYAVDEAIDNLSDSVRETWNKLNDPRTLECLFGGRC
ncbi:MAG: putative Ig domain-containing protein [Planctomycetota bacterium]